MNYLININKINQLEIVCQIAVDEVLVQTKDFSRFGFLDLESLGKCLEQLRKSGKKTILDWNVLAKDCEIYNQWTLLEPYIDQIDFIRFMDPGIGRFLQHKRPNVRLHFSMEFGDFNQIGILKRIDSYKPNLSRVILSNQLPISEIKKIETDVQIEVQGCGRIEIFYSPRKLIHKHLGIDEKNFGLKCASEDRPTQISPLFQNERGTIMYYDKDLFILDELEIFKEATRFYVRLDLYRREQYEVLKELFPDSNWLGKLKENLSSKTTRGFFRVNKTHAPLKRLINPHIRGAAEEKIGIILESVKKQHMVVEIQKELQLPAKLIFQSPEGKLVEYVLKKIENLKGEAVDNRVYPGIYKLPWIKHVVPATVLKLF